MRGRASVAITESPSVAFLIVTELPLTEYVPLEPDVSDVAIPRIVVRLWKSSLYDESCLSVRVPLRNSTVLVSVRTTVSGGALPSTLSSA